MKILIIGGSYFLGKTFTMMAGGIHELYVMNRGNRPFDSDGIIEYVMDRHDKEKLAEIPETYFDVIVDFCAYEEGDIELIFQNLKADFRQYIFISTCDVYRRGSMERLDESAAFEERNFGGAAGAYIIGKVRLEEELTRCAKERQIAYTSIRPAFIYGPENYAPREDIYFKWILTAGQIIHPHDADGEFQMVFVYDAAKAILLACGNEKAFNRAFNLCNDESMTYEDFADLMEEALELPFERVELSVKDVLERQIPLPFPLTKQESEWYDGTAVKELGLQYTDIAKGMKITADYFKEN